MGGQPEYTRSEVMAAAAARLLRDGEVVVVGLGLPQIACLLAKATHAPRLKMVLEIGVAEPEPVDPAIGIADPRMWHRATCHTTFVDILGKLVHRGRVDVGFLGGIQVDQYGNINSTQIGPRQRPEQRFTGSGGACDIAAMARRVIIVMRHERRRFPPRVDYITSPGYLDGGSSREREGLRGGPDKVVTDLAVLGFDPVTRRLRIETLHPGVSREEVQAATGFDLGIDGEVAVTPPPSERELAVLRAIDPDRRYLR